MTTPNNCKNWFQQPGLNLDNKAHFEGTSIYNGNEYTAGQIDAALLGANNATVKLNQIVTKYINAGSNISAAGMAVLIGNTGWSPFIDSPVPYAICDINMLSITSGQVKITCWPGVTFDGTNNTATFDAAGEHLILGYKTANQWEIHLNNGVTLSAV